ncbi:MAG: hypothetical protein ACD_54C00180G0003 [uncultured bacterium]|nr:MAG: hypothetical protein ACD_54C00180G0003 [uncultured bacterium]
MQAVSPVAAAQRVCARAAVDLVVAGVAQHGIIAVAHGGLIIARAKVGVIMGGRSGQMIGSGFGEPGRACAATDQAVAGRCAVGFGAVIARLIGGVGGGIGNERDVIKADAGDAIQLRHDGTVQPDFGAAIGGGGQRQRRRHLQRRIGGIAGDIVQLQRILRRVVIDDMGDAGAVVPTHVEAEQILTRPARGRVAVAKDQGIVALAAQQLIGAFAVLHAGSTGLTGGEA